MSNRPYKVFTGTKSRYLAEKICEQLGQEMGNLSITNFSDGEFEVCFEESIRGVDVFLVQSTFPSADNLMELLLMIDAAKRASARTINAVVPYFGWARQGIIDRKVIAEGGVSLDNIGKVREWGFGGVCIRGDLWNHFDIHSQQDYKELIAHFRKLRKAASS